MNLILAMMLVSLFTAPTFSQMKQERPKDDGTIVMIANSEVEAQLATELGEDEISGNVSVYLKASPRELKEGKVKVEGMNLAFFRVKQDMLSKGAELEDNSGFYGMAMEKGKTQYLSFNKNRTALQGKLNMYVDASVLGTVILPNDQKEETKDAFLTPTVPAVLSVSIEFEKPLDAEVKEIVLQDATIKVEVEAKGADFDNLTFSNQSVRFLTPVYFEVVRWAWFEVGKVLDIQPVNIYRFTFFPFALSGTGEGLAFGEPQLRHEWRKNDVIFNIRAPKNIYRSSYYIFSETEAAGLLNTVDEDDCIEVFFPHEFSPNSLWGGGATFGSGTASAKVISSDENARQGVDFTHLAHEFGHVLGLRHPTSSATASAVPGNSGTLICPSGFANDNPQINSVEHESLISNPLLRFTLLIRSSNVPDCDNSADCGPC